MKKRRDVVWAAGLLDGEGCLSIKRIQRPREGRLAIYYQPWVACGMAFSPQNERAIRILLELFGGNSSQYRQTGNRKDTISWEIVSRQAYEACRKLIPYLVIKREQAEIIVSFYDECEIKKGNKVTLEDLKKRGKYFDRLRELNHKGKLHLQRLSEETPETEKRQSELGEIQPQEDILSDI
jgi:hypothetical protein